MVAGDIPVNGIWGGHDYAGTLIQASDAEIWENSRRTWSRFSLEHQQTISDRAGTSNPVLFLALAKDPTEHKEKVIVGVYSLTAVRESTDRADHRGGVRAGSKEKNERRIDEYNGWVRERDERTLEISASPRTSSAAFRHEYPLATTLTQLKPKRSTSAPATSSAPSDNVSNSRTSLDHAA